MECPTDTTRLATIKTKFDDRIGPNQGTQGAVRGVKWPE